MFTAQVTTLAQRLSARARAESFREHSVDEDIKIKMSGALGAGGSLDRHGHLTIDADGTVLDTARRHRDAASGGVGSEPRCS